MVYRMGALSNPVSERGFFMRTKTLCILAVLTALCLTACSAKKQDSVPEQPTAPATAVPETTAPLTKPESAAAETETETIPEATEALETIEPAATESTGSGNAEELPVEFFFDKKEEKENLFQKLLPMRKKL